MKKSNIITENEICLIDVFTQNNKYQNETWIKKRRFFKKQEKTNIIGNKCFRSVI